MSFPDVFRLSPSQTWEAALTPAAFGPWGIVACANPARPMPLVAVDLNWADQPEKPVASVRLLFDTELVD